MSTNKTNMNSAFFPLIFFVLIPFFVSPVKAALLAHTGTGDCNGSGAVPTEYNAVQFACDDRSRNQGTISFSDVVPYQMSIEFDFPTGQTDELTHVVSNLSGESWLEFDVRLSSSEPFQVQLTLDPTGFGDTVTISPCGVTGTFASCLARSFPVSSGMEQVLFRGLFSPPVSNNTFFGLFADIAPVSNSTKFFSVVMTPRVRQIPEPKGLLLLTTGLLGLVVGMRWVRATG